MGGPGFLMSGWMQYSARLARTRVASPLLHPGVRSTQRSLAPFASILAHPGLFWRILAYSGAPVPSIPRRAVPWPWPSVAASSRATRRPTASGERWTSPGRRRAARTSGERWTSPGRRRAVDGTGEMRSGVQGRQASARCHRIRSDRNRHGARGGHPPQRRAQTPPYTPSTFFLFPQYLVCSPRCPYPVL
jgi:hypothetical protein